MIHSNVPSSADLAAAALAGSFAEIAAAYAKLGIPVLPLHHPVGDSCSCGTRECRIGGKRDRNRGKHPRTRHGVHDSSIRSCDVRDWGWRWPWSNLGLATGYSVDVIDADGPQGLQTLADLMAAGRIPKALAYVRTGSGGVHVYIAATGAGSPPAVAPGIDYRGKGGYVVAPPSMHRSGHEYSWTPVLSLPGGDKARGAKLPVMPWESKAIAAVASAPPRAASRDERFAAGRLKAAIHRIQTAPTGARHTTVYSSAASVGEVVGAGWMTKITACTELVAAAQSAGIQSSEADRTVRRGLNAGMRHPHPLLPARGSAKSVVADVVALIRADIDLRGDEILIGRTRARDRVALDWFLDRALERGDLVVPAPARDLVAPLGMSVSTASSVIKKLTQTPWMSIFRNGSRSAGTCTKVQFVAPEVFHKSNRETSGLLRVPINTVRLMEDFGDLRGGRRRDGSLTPTDEMLLQALPLDGTPITVGEWASAANTSPSSAYNASDPRQARSLADRGLVHRSKGRVWLDQDRAANLEDLAAQLGVTGREKQRAARVGEDREVDLVRLMAKAVGRALIGRQSASERDLLAVQKKLDPWSTVALASVLNHLDGAKDPGLVRAAARRLVDGDTLRESAVNALMAADADPTSSGLIGELAMTAAGVRHAAKRVDLQHRPAMLANANTGEVPCEETLLEELIKDQWDTVLGVVGTHEVSWRTLEGVPFTVTVPSVRVADILPAAAAAAAVTQELRSRQSTTPSLGYARIQHDSREILRAADPHRTRVAANPVHGFPVDNASMATAKAIA